MKSKILNFKKLIVILGPTASGKSDLAVRLAKNFNGEIISADSRQVYKGLNIGSGKITKKEMQGVPHHLLDIANPKRKFTVALFQRVALKEIKKIHARGRVPFLVGGTGFYIQSIVDGIIIPEVKPNWKLRKELAKKSTNELFLMLEKLDPTRAKSIDKHNPHRLNRAIEIVTVTGHLIPKIRRRRASTNFDILQIGIKKSPEELKKAISKRLTKRIDGIILEVKKLHNPPVGGGLSWKRLEELGLEYRFVAQYLQEKISWQEMIVKLQKEIEHFTKRQVTWFKRDKKINWIENQKKAENIVKHFLRQP